MRRGLLLVAVLLTLGQAPVTDQVRVQSALNGCGLVQLEPRTYVLTAPMAMPQCPVQIQGVRERTRLTWGQGDGLVGANVGYYDTMPWTLRDVTLGCTGLVGQCGTAIDWRWPDAPSVNEPTAVISHVTIRPEPTTGAGRSWTRGIRLTNAWNAAIDEVAIHSDNYDPDSLVSAIELHRWSTDVRISRALIYGGKTGIGIYADAVGHGEGTIIDRVAMVHVGTGVLAQSTLPGGRPTPWLTLSDSHINARTHGVFLVGRTQASLTGNLIYGVPSGGQTFVGLYLAGQSHFTRLTANQVYVMGGTVSYGILVDASHGGTITGNVLTDATLGIWLTPSTGGWQLAANAVSGHAWGTQTQGVINQGANP